MDLFRFSTYHHVNSEAELLLDDGNEEILRHKAVFVWAATKEHESVEILISIVSIVFGGVKTFLVGQKVLKHLEVDCLGAPLS